MAVSAVAVLAAAAAIAYAGSAPVHAGVYTGVSTAPGLLAQNGFGDYRNSMAWSMAWFKGKLYVGTGRQEKCVEDETVDFYLVVSEDYRTHPEPGVTCPPNPYNLSLRAEIWQYTPTTGRWRMVYRSPVEPNPRARGKMIARDIAYRGMVVYQGRLYVGDVTADQYIPELGIKYPPRLLSTSDGRHFTSIPATNQIEHSVHGYQRPMGFRSLTVWDGRLYTTMTPDLTGDGLVYEVTRPESAHPGFRRVSPVNLAVFEMEVFHGSLYIGTGNETTGYGVYRISAHRRLIRVEAPRRRQRRNRPVRRWRTVVDYRTTPVVTDGAGRGATVTSVVSMHVFQNHLYVGASGWYNGQIPVSELIRIDQHRQWQVVVGAARTVHGVVKGPVSGLGDGFYNIFTAHFWRMVTYNGAMYVGTNDWSYLVQDAFPGLQPPYLAGVIQSALSGEFGFDLWATCNGADWFPVTRDAFGNMYDFGARTLVSSPDGLFVGSANQAQGTKVWRIGTSPCQSLVHGARASSSHKLAASVNGGSPRQVLTDSQRQGNVVSWDASAGAVKYDVQRAAYMTIPLSVEPPPWLPGGLQFDDQVPDVVPAGTPGAQQIDLPFLDNFTSVGTTSSSYYVDRTAKPGKRYAYRVVAVGSSGYQSPPSSVQMAPEPWPKPTLTQVFKALGSKATAPGSLATVARADNARRDRSATLRTLARMQRTVAPDSDAGVLIQRLERQLRYAGMAGGD